MSTQSIADSLLQDSHFGFENTVQFRQRGRDPLTGLPNHVVFEDRIMALLTLRDPVSCPIGVLIIELRNLSNLEREYGRPAVDQLMVQMAESLRQCFSETRLIARFSSTQFALAFDETGLETGSQPLVHRANSCFAGGVTVGNYLLQPDIGYGFSPTSKNIQTSSAVIERAIRKASQFVYETASPVDPNQTGFLLAKHPNHNPDTFATALSMAIEQNQLELFYQPICSLRDGAIVGAEALLRWHHPTLGLVSAADFVALAEDNGSILELGEWAVYQALQQSMLWSKRKNGDFRIVVNISPNQISLPGFVDIMKSAIDRANFDPAQVELDLSMPGNRQWQNEARFNIAALKAIGVSLAIDDFGASSGTLTDLLDLSPQRIKLDRLMSQRALSDTRAAILVNGLINTCLLLNIETHAKGIETEEQRDMLFNTGCIEGQGYLFSPPIPATKFTAALK